MIFASILHGKEFGEGSSKTRQQPVSIVRHRPLRPLALVSEISNYLDDDVFRQAMKMKLYGMLGPVAAPIVIQVDLQGLILLIHAFSKELLDARVLRIGYMGTDIK